MYTVTLGIVLGLMLTSDFCEAKKKIVCYYTNWSNYRQGVGNFTPADIDPFLCTHIIYSFAILEAGKMIPYDRSLDIREDGGYGYYDQVVALKQQNPNLKVMVAIGGWSNGGRVFSQMAKTKNGRQIFIRSVMDLLTKYKFDGLDLDWQYPAVGLRGGMPEDKQNFNYLIQELQSEFESHARRYNEQKMLLTAAVEPAAQTAGIAYDRFTVCRDLDFVNLMQYDIHGGWETRTGFNAPLDVVQGEATPQNVIKVSTDQWINAGCAPHKLILGLPTYGRAWNTSSSMVHNQASGPANPGRFTGFRGDTGGILSYYEICERVSNTSQSWMTEYYPQAAEVVGYSSQSGEMVTYDNKRSMSDKVDYLNSLGLGGAMIWSLDFDDFTGTFCNEGKYPLLTAINQRLGASPSRTTRRPTQ